MCVWAVFHVCEHTHTVNKYDNVYFLTDKNIFFLSSPIQAVRAQRSNCASAQESLSLGADEPHLPQAAAALVFASVARRLRQDKPPNQPIWAAMLARGLSQGSYCCSILSRVPADVSHLPRVLAPMFALRRADSECVNIPICGDKDFIQFKGLIWIQCLQIRSPGTNQVIQLRGTKTSSNLTLRVIH